MAKENLDKWVDKTLNGQKEFEWKMADLPTLWAAL
jgi:hypothetical protein